MSSFRLYCNVACSYAAYSRLAVVVRALIMLSIYILLNYCRHEASIQNDATSRSNVRSQTNPADEPLTISHEMPSPSCWLHDSTRNTTRNCPEFIFNGGCVFSRPWLFLWGPYAHSGAWHRRESDRVVAPRQSADATEHRYVLANVNDISLVTSYEGHSSNDRCVQATSRQIRRLIEHRAYPAKVHRMFVCV